MRRAVRDDAEQLADSLARAFSDDPGFAHVLPDPGDRTDRLRIFFETGLRRVPPLRGFVWTTEELVAAAVWGPPGESRVPITASLREGAAMRLAFGRLLP